MVRTWPVLSAGWAALFCVVVALGRQLLLPGTGLAVFWPAAGVAALWMTWSARQGRLAVDACLLVASTAVVNHVFGVGHAASLLFGVSNLVHGLVVAHWWGRARRLGDGSTPRDLARLLAVSVVAGALSCVPASLAAVLSGADVGWTTVAHLVVRNATGSVVVVAVVQCVAEAVRRSGGAFGRGLDPTGTGRPAGLELALATAGSVALNTWVFGPPQQLPLAFLPLGTAAWVGGRFAPWVAALHGAATGAAALVLTYLGRGPFGGIDAIDERVLVVQVFVVLTVVLTLLLSLGNLERQALLDRALSSEAAARERAALLDAVLHVMRDGLVLVDDQGRITVRNRAADELIGRTDGASGASPHGLRQHSGRPLDLAQLATHLPRHGAVDDHDFEVRGSDGGHPRVVSLSAVPLSTDGTSHRRYAVVGLRDVTEERRRVRELEDYAGVVAHDLKNPIAAVMSWAGLLDHDLRRMPDSDLVLRARSGVGNLQVAAEQAHTLVDELLQYARAQTGALETERLSLDEVLAGVVGSVLAGPLRDPRPIIETTPLPDVVADPTLVRQVLLNVVGNAVTYVAPGVRPHVCVSGSAADGWVTVAVQDNGVGVPHRDRDRVLDSFYRSPATAHLPGNGLGLAIAARAVERHGGRIRLRSAPDGGGTVVSFTLPAA